MKPKRKMRIVVMFSGGASALSYLLNQPDIHEQTYEFVGAFTNNGNAPGRDIAEVAGIPVAMIDYQAWCAFYGSPRKDVASREEYFRRVSELIAPFKPDIIMLSGFMLVMPESFVQEHAFRILNVHPSDLRTVYANGKRKYIGDHAVHDAMTAGETTVRSTIHLVTKQVDAGPILFVSDPVVVSPTDQPETIQQIMKFTCDGPVYRKALIYFAEHGEHISAMLGEVPASILQNRVFSDEVSHWLPRLEAMHQALA
jgi:folate-dependent phosphoribosylglycinamide formyltransferase PurN